MAQRDEKNPDLRVSDAERDAAAGELGQHFQDGRLDRAEFDDRVTAAMVAKTRRDLDELLSDLPQVSAGHSGSPGSEPGLAAWPGASPSRPALAGLTRGRPRALALLALLVAVAVSGSLLSGGWGHAWPLAPFGFLWLIVPVLAVRTWACGGRWRQWR
jgi:hypothetical protein